MKIRIAVILLLLPFVARSATEWPVIGLEILPGGWEIAATVSTSPDLGSEAAVTNLNYFNGWDYYRDTLRSTNYLQLDITGQGYDSTGTLVTKARKINGARLKRLNYPMQNTNVVVAQNTTNVHALITSTDYIYADETITATSKSGWLATTNDAANWTNAATFTLLSVTNSSTLAHVEPSINWVWPGMQRWTNTTEYVAVDGGHWSGVSAIRFDAIDENSNTNTSWAVRRKHPFGTGQQWDSWVGEIDTSTFSNFNRIRVDFTVFPKYGDAVFSTLSNRWSGLTILPSAQTNYLDRYNAFTNIAVVAIDGGAGNQAATNGSPENVSSAQYFEHINTAMNRLSASNWQTVGISMPIGTIYVRAGVTNQSGSNLSHSNNPASWTIIKNYPGDVVTLTNRTGDNDLSDCVKFEGITLGFPSGNICLVGCDQVWVDNCTINSTSTALWNTCSRINYTDVTIERSSHAPQNGTFFQLLRNVDVSGQTTTILLHNGIGLTKNSKTNTSFNLATVHASLNYYPSHVVWKNFDLKGLEAATGINIGGATNTHFGSWYENLMFEGIADGSFQIHSVGNDTNTVIKNCSFVGYRNQLFYNDLDALFHDQARVYNTIFTASGFASDVSEADSALTNNHPQRYMVGYQGNAFQQGSNYASHGHADWGGLDSYYPGANGYSNAIRYVDFKAYAGVGTPDPNVGFGDYRLLTDNEFLILNQRSIEGTDVYGQNYGKFRAPGAIGSSNARKGVMFW